MIIIIVHDQHISLLNFGKKILLLVKCFARIIFLSDDMM